MRGIALKVIEWSMKNEFDLQRKYHETSAPVCNDFTTMRSSFDAKIQLDGNVVSDLP